MTDTLDLGPWDCAGQAAIRVPVHRVEADLRCSICKRRIWRPLSVSREIGSECWDLLHGATATRRHDVAPEQLDLITLTKEPPMEDVPESRPCPPPLIQQNPMCRLCMEEVEHDGDGWHCPRCKAWWSSSYGAEDDLGQWDDPDEPQCASVGLPRNGGDAKRCMRGETHVDSDDREQQSHEADGMCWGRNSWIVETTPALTIAERDARDAAVTA